MNEVAQTRTPDTQLFRDVFNASPIGIAVENLDGQPLFVNSAFCSFLGFSEEELSNKHCVDFSPPEDAEKDWALFQQVKAGSIDHYQLDKRYFRKDGSMVWGRLSVSLLRSRPSPLVIAMVDDITDKKKAEEALSGMTRNLIEAQEQERSRIGRELHDDINQRLAMLAVELDQLHEDPSKLGNRVQELRNQTIELLSDVQAMSHDLHSSKLEYLGVVAGIKSWCQDFAERRKLRIDFNADVSSLLPLEIGLTLFRVLQEAVNNTIKHSGVKRIEVQLRERSGEIELVVRDSGSGFDVDAALQGRGLGLTSMRERVRLVNGTISIESKPLAGTTIHVRVPLESKHAATREAV